MTSSWTITECIAYCTVDSGSFLSFTTTSSTSRPCDSSSRAYSVSTPSPSGLYCCRDDVVGLACCNDVMRAVVDSHVTPTECPPNSPRSSWSLWWMWMSISAVVMCSVFGCAVLMRIIRYCQMRRREEQSAANHANVNAIDEGDDVTITTISGSSQRVNGGSTTSLPVDPNLAPVLMVPPPYDTLLPLYDDKDLPKYSDVVGSTQPSPAQETPSTPAVPDAVPDDTSCNTQTTADDARE